MAEKKVTRKLAAILATDMVGYSRLMEKDEEGTIARQKAHRAELIDPKFAEHGGRIVKSTGDGLLVEFASAVDAVRCAAEVQRAMIDREAGVPEDRRIAYRVGINIGDIVIDGDDILGDGVNIAARLEALAEPGGICISRTVLTHIRNKVELGFIELGPQRVKNIEEPVPAYKVLLDPTQAGTVVAAKRTELPRLRWAAIAAAVVLLAAAILAWWQPWAPRFEPARLAKMAFPLPKKPSIAVLAFDDLSGDRKLEFFGDGLAEEIMTVLASRSELFVTARNSSFTYKGKAVKPQQVAEELGVRYVLEGSVRREGDKLRVVAQLIDAVDGTHIWAGRYDRKAANIFEVQDEIAEAVSLALKVKLTLGESAVPWQAPPGTDLRAREARWLGSKHFLRFNKVDNARARDLLVKAKSLAPEWHALKVFIAWSHMADVAYGWAKDRKASYAAALRLADEAKSSGVIMPLLSDLYGIAALFAGRHDEAVKFGQQGVELGPNDADAHAVLAYFLNYAGRPDDAILMFEKAMRLSPFYPDWYLEDLGKSYYLAGQIDNSIASLTKQLERNPKNQNSRVYLTGIYGQLGRIGEAKVHAKQIMLQSPDFTIAQFLRSEPFKDPSVLDKLVDGLRKAGLPSK